MKNNYTTISKARNVLSANDLIKNLFTLLAFKYNTQSTRYTRVDDRFDVMRRLSYKVKGSANG